MAEALESLVRVLAGALGEDADATSIADALWLAAAPAAPTATEAAPCGDLPEPAPSDAAGADPASPSASDTDTPVSPRPVEDAGTAVLYERLPHARPAPGTSVAVPGGRDLPRAMELRRALRPFKRRYSQGRRSELDLDATVRDYRRTGELTPVMGPSPEPWFEVLLVVDASPTMAVWQNTNAEFATLLAGLGAFRRVRTWSLRPGPTPVVTDHQDRRVAPGQAVSSDGRRLVLVLSDCVAPGWRQPETWQLLRSWGAKGPVALLNPLPARLWHRTGLDLPAIRVGQRRPALRNSDLTFHVPLLVRTLPGAKGADWRPLPTLTFSPHSLARWAETFMRGAPHGYDAVLVPRTGIVPSLFPPPNGAQRTGPDPTEVFLRTGSPLAVRLAALCSPFGRLSLPLMHLIRQQILPEAGVGDLAELLTSPVVNIQTYEDGPAIVFFDETTRQRLASRLSRRDAWLTYDALSRHVAARSPGGAVDIQAIATSEPDSVPPALYPFARASNDLLKLLREGEPVRRAPLPGVSEGSTLPPVPGPSRGLPDPERTSALLIGSSGYKGSRSRREADAAIVAMRAFLTSPEGWDLPAERCVSLRNLRNLRGAGRDFEEVHRAAEVADTVLLYFAGLARVDKGGQLLDFDHAARILGESRPRHIMVILDQTDGVTATWAQRTWDLRGLAGSGNVAMQMLFAETAHETGFAGPVTQELLRVATEGVPGGPEFLDLPTIAGYMNTLVYTDRISSRPQTRFIGGAPGTPAFARNRAWPSPTSPARTDAEDDIAVADSVEAVHESVRQRIEAALPRSYQGAYRREVDRFLLALLAFAADFIDGAERADSVTALLTAVKDFLDRRGISMRERHVVDQRVGLLWPSDDGSFAIYVTSDGDPGSWNAAPLLNFELVLEVVARAETPELSDCVSTTAGASDDGERPCVVTMRLPVPQRRPHDPEVTLHLPEAIPHDAERDAMNPFPGDDGGPREASLADAVASACEELLGDSVGDPSADDSTYGVWALYGVELPAGITDLTIHGITPDTDSIVWDTVEEYEYGLVLGQVTVDVVLVLGGFMYKADYALAMPEVRLLRDVNDYTVAVSVERNAQLVFDARRELDDVELEFRGTNPNEPHPHEPM
ncbi:SAV_2336 N-terminal domain-related protein [Streptomyces sp. NPDC020766]|uniref:SAV_2336 N-terminal domain-related protein n=1 Tax=Streptomyces sp. NPDC020766 TaxID=3155011 RepID=UPI0033F53AA3